MERTIVIYQGAYGTTKQYAEWLGEALDCPVRALAEFDKKELNDYDHILYGGRVKAGGLDGFDKFKKWIKTDLKIRQMVKDGTLTSAEADKAGARRKHIAVFAVGINVDSQETRQQFREINFNKKYMKHLTCYFLPGAYDPAVLTGSDKFIMGMAMKMIAKQSAAEREASDSSLLERLEKGCDLVDKERIKPIIKDFTEYE